ncbi:uncharacterized protein LOC144211740 [Stigmatopora nigra]
MCFSSFSTNHQPEAERRMNVRQAESTKKQMSTPSCQSHVSSPMSEGGGSRFYPRGESPGSMRKVDNTLKQTKKVWVASADLRLAPSPSKKRSTMRADVTGTHRCRRCALRRG